MHIPHVDEYHHQSYIHPSADPDSLSKEVLQEKPEGSVDACASCLFALSSSQTQIQTIS